jgi:hypothetical protein
MAKETTEAKSKCSGLGPCEGMMKVSEVTNGVLEVMAIQHDKEGKDLRLRTRLRNGRLSIDFKFCPDCGVNLEPLRVMVTASPIITPN